MLVVLLRRQIIAQKLLKLKKKPTDHDHDKYITTSKFNTLASNVFNARLAQANLVTTTNFDNKVSRFDSKIVANKIKNKKAKNT